MAALGCYLEGYHAIIFLNVVLMPVNKISKPDQSSRVSSTLIAYLCMTIMYYLNFDRHLLLATMVWEDSLTLLFQYPELQNN